MTHIRTVGHFEAPIARVFELLTDYKTYPEWNVNYVDVPEVVGPTNQVGTKIRAVMKLLGRTMEGWAEVTQIDPPNRLTITGKGNDGGSTTVEYRLQAVGLTTEVEALFDYELPAGPFGKIADKLFIERTIERDLRHSIENFKALVEAPQPILV